MPTRIWVLWILFLVRGTFYSAMLPLWEGWDEYAHFAFVQHWSDHGTLPRTTDRISREIDESMRVAPLAGELRWIGPPYLTHADWWTLPATEREARVRALRSLSPALAHQPATTVSGKPAFVFYEAQQPPLFYWMASVVARPMAGLPIGDRVFRLRLLGLFFTSLAIPFTFLAARRIFGDGGMAGWCAALLAVAPGLVIDASRVANDGLAIGLAAVFLWLMTRESSHWLWVGLVLGVGILAKASLLVLVLVLVVLWIRKPRQMGLALVVALAVGGWWYARNLMIGAPLTGWLENVPMRTMVNSAIGLLRTGRWVDGAQTIAKSFTWFGAWSFMTLRAWMYLALEILAVVGMVAGFAVKRKGSLRVPLVVAVCFAFAIAVGAAIYDAMHGIPGIPGWYLWPAGGAMAILIVGGLGRFSVGFAAMLALADLFGATVRMMPFYAGLAEWNHGAVGQGLQGMERLGVGGWIFAAWVVATVGVPVVMWWGGKNQDARRRAF